MTDSPLLPRARRLADLAEGKLDVLVVGGGVTGIGVALDAAARGLSVGLVERGDWCGETSSASSRLVHGGLRYLEQFELGLVRESCLERAWLLDSAAGYVWPETFAFPVRRGDRVGLPKLAAGLALYTLLSLPRTLGLPGILSRARTVGRVPKIEADRLVGAGHYLDAATDDARLGLAALRTAAREGAVCASRCEALSVDDGPGAARVRWRDVRTGEEAETTAAAVVLCGGPGTEALRERAGLGGRWVAPTRGSHLVVDRHRLPTEGAVIFDSAVDGRVMFLIPWARRTVIGTTDLDADPGSPPACTREEVRYLLASANGLCPAAGLTETDVLSTWSGLRPLLAAPEDDPSARSREERLVREGRVWTIAGGKLTGFRAMAEKLGAQLAAHLRVGIASRRSPTRQLALDGAQPRRVSRPTWTRFDPTAEPSAVRAAAHARRYAARAPEVAAACQGSTALDPETLLAEVDWAVEHDDCLDAVDFLFRRTDVGYNSEDRLRVAVPPVLDRLGDRLRWGRDDRRRAEEALDERLRLTHGWREEPG